MQNLLNPVQKHNVAVEKFVQPIKTFDDYAEDISKANKGSLNAQIEIGKIFTEAKEKLGKKEFNKLDEIIEELKEFKPYGKYFK